MKHRFLFLCACLLCTALLLCAAGCGGDARGILAYQSHPLHLRVAYEAGGAPTEAEILLGAGGAERDMTLTVLSPEDAAGLTLTRSGSSYTASRAGLEVPMADLSGALSPLAFFCIPETAAVTGIEKEDDRRTVTLTDGDTVWTLCFNGSAEVPAEISRTEGERFRGLSVLEVLP